MRLLLFTLLLSLALPASAALPAVARPADFATGMKLRLQGEQPFHRLELPLAAHAQARPDLADVRIFNAEGEAVPHAFARGEAAPAAPAPTAVPRFPLHAPGGGQDAPALDVKIEQDGRLISLQSRYGGITGSGPVESWLFDLSALRQPVQALLLDWPVPANGFSTEARLEGSDDLKAWQPLVTAPLLDLAFGGQRLQQKRIAFPASRFRYLRLMPRQPLPPLSAAAVDTLPAAALVPERWLEVPGHPGPASGEYVFDLGARLVATRLELKLPQPNTVAPVEWLVRERQRDDWRSVTRATLYRLRRDGADMASPALATGAQAGRYWLLRVDPRAGGLGSGTPVLRLAWRPTQLVFLARGTPPFTLAFGQRDAAPVQLPLASLLPGYRPGMEADLPLASVGPAMPLGGHNAPAPGEEDTPPPDWKRWLLWGILLLGVGLLAAMARSLLRQKQAAG